ncbi:MAG: GNAT family N-acetyltransferase, partial [Butyrivibrio sp.]|nr:GNAT family N-acetyltransferase [Butyrivibrio sp.]
VQKNFIYRETFTPQTHLAWIENHINTGDAYQMIICSLSENGKAVGSVYFRDIDREKGQAEYGIFIGEDDAIGKGFGNETATLALKVAQDNLGLSKLILRVFTDNTAAYKSYEHAGFYKTEDLPGVECSDGEVKDMILMEKTL